MAQKIGLGLIAALFLAVVYAAIGIPIIEPDAAIYAEIAREMFVNQSYQITYKGEDWLDKPHLPFWLSALAYSVFGVTLFGYKLPALLASVLGVYYTYKFALRYYDRRIAWLAVGILISAEHFILSLNDVRAEPFLMGFMAMAFYHLIVFYEQGKSRDFWLSALASGLMIMTKGIFVLIPLFTAIFAAILLTKHYKELIKTRWYLWILAVLAFTSPVIVAYYLQFDAQPMKAVDLREWGVQTQVSGIKFFFWDSQFGRFFNTGPIQGEGTFDFYFHSLLWAFWPWGLLIYFAVGHLILNLIKKRPNVETYTLFATLPMFLVFSLSSFQLPHYLNILFPFMAIMSAAYLIRFFEWSKPLRWLHIGYVWFAASLFLAIPILFTDFQFSWLGYTLFAAILALFASQFFAFRKIALWSFISLSLLINLIIHTEFYPKLLDYQASTTAAKFIEKDPVLRDLPLAAVGVSPRAIEFNLNRLLHPLELCQTEPMLVLVNETSWSQFKSTCPNATKLTEFSDYPVSRMTLDFVKTETRPQAIDRVFLVQTRP
jgi:4-amino-4-deoxy-L-arabinose transferase-like glycosyltransferase